MEQSELYHRQIHRFTLRSKKYRRELRKLLKLKRHDPSGTRRERIWTIRRRLRFLHHDIICAKADLAHYLKSHQPFPTRLKTTP